MNIVMAGIDYSLAEIDLREKFSLTNESLEDVYRCLKGDPSVLGAVIISTCNRSEIYLSLKEQDKRDPFEILCWVLNLPEEYCGKAHHLRRGMDVFRHLALLGCGAKSQIWGEDQIISQVKNSISISRNFHAADSYLEVLFRTAITAAKKIKSNIIFSHSERSVADQALDILENESPRPNRVMVIGNGEIGRLCALKFKEANFETWMTLRSYKHGRMEPVEGVTTIDYNERYDRMPLFDAVISATLSPHFTLEYSLFYKILKKPKLMIDLAVPRDIDPRIGTLEGIKLFDIDTMAKDKILENHAKLMEQMESYLQKYQEDFQKWYEYKESIKNEKTLCPGVGSGRN